MLQNFKSSVLSYSVCPTKKSFKHGLVFLGMAYRVEYQKDTELGYAQAWPETSRLLTLGAWTLKEFTNITN